MSIQKIQWLDISQIVAQLEEHHCSVDIANINFMLLRELVLKLPGFEGQPERCNEKILEAIQSAWLEKRDE